MVLIRHRLTCIVLAGVLLLTSGCWEYRKLNAIALVLGMALDQTEEGALRVTLQFPLPSMMKGGGGGGSQGGGQGQQFYIVQGTGLSLPEALADAQQRLSRPMSFGHLQVVLLSEAVGRAERKDWLEQLWRFAELDKLSYVLVVSGSKAEDALNVVPPQERLPALYLTTVMQTLNRSKTQAKPSTLLDGLVLGREPGRDFLATVVEVESNSGLRIDRVAIFQASRLVTILSPEETTAILLALGDVRNLSLSVEGKGGARYVVRRIRVTDTQTRLETGAGADRLSIRVRVAAEAAGAVGPSLQIGQTLMDQMEEAVSTLLQRRLVDTIKRLQELEVDPIGFYARRYPPPLDDEAWRRAYSKAKLNVVVETLIQRKGTVD